MKNITHLYKRIYTTISALLIIFTIYTTIMPSTIFAFSTNSVVSKNETVSQDDFDKKFREGRDLMDKEEWAKATEKFTEVIDKYPTNKSTDAAMYWLAFCHKKQKQFKETDATIARLLKDFPDSSWASDAKVMRLEVNNSLLISGYPNLIATSPARVTGTYSAPQKLLATASVNGINTTGKYTDLSRTYETYLNFDGINTTNAKVPLEREDEIKLAAFQSLFSSDPKRAIEAMSQMFQNAKAGENLKIEVLRAVRRPKLFNSQSLTTVATNLSAKPDVNSLTQLLKEPLLNIYQKESSIKIRKEILFILGSLNDSESLNYLVKLYMGESSKELKKSIISSLFQSTGNVFAFQTTNNPANKPEFSKLLEIMKSEKDPELLSFALNNIQLYTGMRLNEQMLQVLIEIYEANTDESLKISVIQALAKVTQPQSTKKLLDIAKTEKSDKLKLEAIRALGKSKDPEALKYLEDLIK